MFPIVFIGKPIVTNLPIDMGGTFVDLAYGQLYPHGASSALIQAVRNANDALIRCELLRVKNLEQRQRLIDIIQRIGPILGQTR